MSRRNLALSAGLPPLKVSRASLSLRGLFVSIHRRSSSVGMSLTELAEVIGSPDVARVGMVPKELFAVLL